MKILLYKVAGVIALLWVSYGLGYGTRAYKAKLEDAVRVGQQKEVDAANVKALQRREDQKRESDEATKQVLAWGVAERDRLAARVERLRKQASEGGGMPTVPGTDGSLAACQERLNDISRKFDAADAGTAESNRQAALCAEDVTKLGECQQLLTQCRNRR